MDWTGEPRLRLTNCRAGTTKCRARIYFFWGVRHTLTIGYNDGHHVHGDEQAMKIGDSLGSYRVLAKLGEGGMGEVYRAHDSKLQRDVALKVLPPEIADDRERRGYLLREARAAAALNHPNICTIYEVGEAGTRVFIAMEVIDGQTLTERLAHGALPLDQIIRYGVQLTDAVAHAHDRGVVHRDLKSANVLITSDDRVKVLDFGLARRLSGQQLGENTTQSQHFVSSPGAVVGTLPYMSPEQLRGQPADLRTDIWACGVVLYEMAAGKRPFAAQSPIELSSAILRDSPPPLSLPAPEGLRAIVSRCLDKEPARRYQRASELRAAIDMLSTRTAPIAASSRYQAPSRRAIIAAALAAAVLLATGAVWWVASIVPSRAPGDGAEQIQSIAVLPLDNLSGNPNEEYFVAGIQEGLITDLARIGLQKVIAKPSADAFKGTNTPLGDIGRELGVAGLITGSVMRTGTRVQVNVQLVRAASGTVLWANRFEENAGDVLTLQNRLVAAVATEIRQSLTREQRLWLAAARPVNPAAHDAYLKGRSLMAAFVNSAMSQAALDTAIAELERAIELDPAYAPPYALLSNAHLNASQSSLQPPAVVMPKARTAAIKAVALDDTLADAHAALADVELWYGWNWSAAEHQIRRALELSPDSTSALRASQNYLTLVGGRYDEAARASQRILDLDPLNPFSRLQSVWVTFFSRRHDESIARAKTLRELYPENILVPYFLAANYAVQRREAETMSECERLIVQLQSSYVMRLLGQCVWAEAVVGRTRDARRVLERLERPPPGIWLDPVVLAQAYPASAKSTVLSSGCGRAWISDRRP